MRILHAALLVASCSYLPRPSEATGQAPTCQLVEDERWGPDGKQTVVAETVADGLEVPWAIGFLPSGDALVTERPGRIRLLHAGKLAAEPVATVQTAEASEGGLLGLAVDPQFESNHRFYVYVTAPDPNGKAENRVERWLYRDGRAQRDAVLLAGIAAGTYHDGGRIRFGPDGALYVGTGDGREPDRSPDPRSLNGKLLRLTTDGAVRVVLRGIRNLEAFDWLDATTFAIADHGPSGELARRGHDEVSLAHEGDDLGWPGIYGCQMKPGAVSPILSWVNAVPPGGLVVYRGSEFPSWKGSLLIASLGSKHLHRVDPKTSAHEVYLRNQLGRLREIVQTPSGELWVTTSNCDGRGDCGSQKDRIVRLKPR